MKTQLTFILLLLLVVANIKSFSQNSYPFEVVISGQGERSLIFIPGFASSGDVWNETLAEFKDNFTCYTFTMAGFAGVAPKPNITFEHWKTEIANYIKANKIQQPILVGHSMGGALAMALAADYPEIIAKIVVVDALPMLAALANPDFKSDKNLDCSDTVNQFIEMNDDHFYKMQKASIPMMITNTEMHDTVVGWSVASDRETFATMYCDFYNTDLRTKLANITCPSLILLESYFINLKPAIEAQYKNLKNSQLVYANKGLHFIMYDDKEWYFAQLHQFISVN